MAIGQSYIAIALLTRLVADQVGVRYARSNAKIEVDLGSCGMRCRATVRRQSELTSLSVSCGVSSKMLLSNFPQTRPMSMLIAGQDQVAGPLSN